ncbi:hypothetical protein BE08_26075 [Sorangium cellulosum]|uniref:Uncharacterized protein n=1 Tax=Sorangium cellulosum TaxID=56 RepID=A0A150PG76_SORCE|nr:hypothetical protein BE08_26075 [Sorangium cellulosum]
MTRMHGAHWLPWRPRGTLARILRRARAEGLVKRLARAGSTRTEERNMKDTHPEAEILASTQRPGGLLRSRGREARA